MHSWFTCPWCDKHYLYKPGTEEVYVPCFWCGYPIKLSINRAPQNFHKMHLLGSGEGVLVAEDVYRELIGN